MEVYVFSSFFLGLLFYLMLYFRVSYFKKASKWFGFFD